MEITYWKLSLWLWALGLVVLKRPSEAGESMLVRPPNLQCACPSDVLRFNCTVVVEDMIGATIWSGTALTGCDGGRIQLRHSNENAVGQCNGGALSARSFPIVSNCITSELNVTIDSTLNNTTVQCALNSNSGTPTIGVATITLMTGPYQQAPGGVTLTDVRPGILTFSWSQIDPNCPRVQYPITSNCGNCPNTTSGTSADCYGLQLSTTARNCTFSVDSEICEFTGPSSNPITVTLKVPDAPQINHIPVYSEESRALTNLIIEIRSQMDSFSIYKGISGSIVNYTIRNSSSTIKTVLACVDDVCEYELRPPLVCPSSSGDSSISVSATNRLGSGNTSQLVTVGCTNRFVTVDIESTTSTLTCQFQNDQNAIQKTCIVVYRVCGQDQVFTVEGNSTAESPDRVQLSLPSGANCYTYTITAYDGTSTAMIEGMVDQSDEGSTNVAAIVVPVVVVLMLIVAAGVVVIVLVTWRLRSRQKQYDSHELQVQPGSPENKGNVSLANPIYAKHENTDSGGAEPEDLHRGESNLGIDQEKQESVNAVQEESSLGDIIAQDGKNLESAPDQPYSNLGQFGNDSNAATSDEYRIGGGGGGALGGYAGDDDYHVGD